MIAVPTTTAGSIGDIAARIERLPTAWWRIKTQIIVGVATFFDAFDAHRNRHRATGAGADVEAKPT